MSVIPALERLSQGDEEFEVCLDYIARFHFQKKTEFVTATGITQGDRTSLSLSPPS
jgi:hypothetical protein